MAAEGFNQWNTSRPGRIFEHVGADLAFSTAVSVLAFSSAVYSPQARAKDVGLADFPFLVNCEVDGVHHAYYLSKIGADGAPPNRRWAEKGRETARERHSRNCGRRARHSTCNADPFPSSTCTPKSAERHLTRDRMEHIPEKIWPETPDGRPKPGTEDICQQKTMPRHSD